MTSSTLTALGPRYKWIALSNTTLGVLIATINSSILLIALPDIFRGLRINPLAPGNSSYLLWLIMGYLVVTAVLVVTFGRLGDMYGRVKMYNTGFAIFTFFSIALSVVWLDGTAGVLYLIIMRLLQGVGGALLMANSSAIITDAFPADQRGLALGLNMVAGIAGSFLGLVIGGVLAPIDWRLVFLVSVPFSLFGTVWGYLKLRDLSPRRHHVMDWWGNITFAAGLIAVLVAITYGIQPYGDHIMGWTNPWVMGSLIGGVALLAVFCVIETKVEHPMFHIDLFKIRAFSMRQPRQPARRSGPRRADVHPDHLAAGHLAAAPRLHLRVHAAVGRHLHAADDGRVPGRRAALGLAVRPLRRALVRDRRDADRGRQLRVVRGPAGGLHLLDVRRGAVRQRLRDGAVRLAQPRRDHELPAGQPSRRRRRDEHDVPEHLDGALDRHLLLADDRRARRLAAGDDAERPDRARRTGRRRRTPSPACRRSRCCSRRCSATTRCSRCSATTR